MKWADVESKAEFIQSLEEKVESISGLIAAEKESAIAATTETLKREFAHQSALSEIKRKMQSRDWKIKLSFLRKNLAAPVKRSAHCKEN